MSFDVGTIVGMLGLDNIGFVSGILEAKGIASIFPSVVTDFLVNPLLGFGELTKEIFHGVEWSFERAIDAVREYGKTVREVALADAEAAEKAQALGLSVESFTGLAAAAKFAGADTMALSEGIKFLNRNVADAATGNQDLRKEFYQLGVSVVDATGHLRGTEDVFYDVADAISRLPNAALQTKFALDLVGRGSEDLLPFLLKGSAGIRQYVAEATRFGVVTSKESGEAGDKFRHIAADWDLMWKGIESHASSGAIKLIAGDAGDLQTKMYGLSGLANAGIDVVFKWLNDHRGEIVAAFDAIGAEAKVLWADLNADWPAIRAEIGKLWDKCVGWKNYIVTEWPAISAECKVIFKTMETGAISAGDTILNLAEDWVRLRVAMEAYTHTAGDMQVKASNDFANQFMKETGHPYSAAMPFVGMQGSDIKGMNLAFGINDLIAPISKAAPSSSAPAPAQPTYNVNTTVQVDASKVASEILKQIAPSMKKAIDEVHSKSTSAGRIVAQRKGL